MKKLVHKYLSAQFYFENKELHARATLEPIFVYKLRDEIKVVFDLDADEFKKILRTWWNKHTRTGSFKQFWNVRWFNGLTAHTVFPRLISSELVSVQPLAMPTGLLFHMNYNTGNHNALIGIDMALSGSLSHSVMSFDAERGIIQNNRPMHGRTNYLNQIVHLQGHFVRPNLVI